MNFLTEHGIDSYAQLTEKLSAITDNRNRVHAEIKAIEARQADLALVMKHTATYRKLKPIYEQYRRSGDKEKFMRGHESEIILFEAATPGTETPGRCSSAVNGKNKCGTHCTCFKKCVFDALGTGYRLIDTAQAYYNEKEVGEGIQRAIKELGIRREDIFLTTKVWVTEFGYEKAKASVEESLRKLQTDYLDLVLIHQCLSDYYSAYRALEDLYDEGKIRAIGISNFSAERMAGYCNF